MSRRPRDPRVTALSPDIASRALEGIVPAPAYVDPRPMTAVVPATGIHAAADSASEQQDQLLFGETFEVLREADGFAWGQARRDGYVGYVRLDALAVAAEAATHRVFAIRTYAFAGPSIKSRATGPISLNALVAEEGRDGRFIKARNGGWFVAEHLAPIGRFETDPVEVALRFVGAAYLWGGRESHGLDCSGLVQQALLACGRACPRDTDQQQHMGHPIEPDALARGDLVFWRGHVAMMADATHIVHANAHSMSTVVEPFAEAVARIAAGPTGEPVAYRRIV